MEEGTVTNTLHSGNRIHVVCQQKQGDTGGLVVNLINLLQQGQKTREKGKQESPGFEPRPSVEPPASCN